MSVLSLLSSPTGSAQSVLSHLSSLTGSAHSVSLVSPQFAYRKCTVSLVSPQFAYRKCTRSGTWHGAASDVTNPKDPGWSNYTLCVLPSPTAGAIFPPGSDVTTTVYDAARSSQNLAGNSVSLQTSSGTNYSDSNTLFSFYHFHLSDVGGDNTVIVVIVKHLPIARYVNLRYSVASLV